MRDHLICRDYPELGHATLTSRPHEKPKLVTAWHGCPKHFIKPKGNAKFWRDKIATNRARDRKVNHTLRSMGWKVARVWEHELKRRDEPQLVRRLMRILGRSA